MKVIIWGIGYLGSRICKLRGLLKDLIDILNNNGIEVIGLLDTICNYGKEEAIHVYLSKHS